jgi:hypothetical protein
MTFPFFFIIAHIDIYFIVHIAFLNVVHYKNTQHNVRSLIVGQQSSKTHMGPRCTFNLPVFGD